MASDKSPSLIARSSVRKHLLLIGVESPTGKIFVGILIQVISKVEYVRAPTGAIIFRKTGFSKILTQYQKFGASLYISHHGVARSKVPAAGLAQNDWLFGPGPKA